MEPLGISQSEAIVRLSADEVAMLAQSRDTDTEPATGDQTLSSEFADLGQAMADSPMHGTAVYRPKDGGPKPIGDLLTPEELAQLIADCTRPPLPREDFRRLVKRRGLRRPRLGGIVLSDTDY